MNLLLIVLVMIGGLSAGCATIMNSSTVDVMLTTTPPDADAMINGQTYKTTTPVTIPVPRGKDDLSIHIEKEGFESQDVKLERQMVGWVWGNVILGGLIGFGIDLITQRAWSVEPKDIQVSLKPARLGSVQAPSSPSSLDVKPPPTVVVSDVDLPRRTQATRKNNAHAIVIGLETYRNHLPKADYAGQDAQVMAEYLAKTMGYEEANVAVLLNERATKGDLEKYIESWLPNRVEKDDSVFIFYSGHGAPNPRTGEAYLVPYDGDPTFIENTGYPLKRLYQHLANLPAKEVIVVLDSCFSGAGGRSVVAQGMRPIVTELKSPLIATGKTVVLSASTGQQVSSTYGQKAHGLLTYFLLKGLQGEGDTNKDGSIDLMELFEYLKPQVERVARREFNNEQTPQLLGSSELLNRGVRLLE